MRTPAARQRTAATRLPLDERLTATLGRYRLSRRYGLAHPGGSRRLPVTRQPAPTAAGPRSR
jgi:hypothetical protein